MSREKYLIFHVTFKYRLKKGYELEAWKPKYGWKHNAYYVRCRDRYEIETIIMKEVAGNHEGEHQIKISEVSEVSTK